MTKHFIYKIKKVLGRRLDTGHNIHLKIHIKKGKPFSTNNSRVMHLFNIPIHVPGVHHCQKYASASHQVPANQKIIQLLFRKCTHCYQHSTKERLNHGQQSFETHFDTHETPHHDTIFNHRIDRLPNRYVSQIPSLCLCHVCACTCLHMCVCGYVCVYIHRSYYVALTLIFVLSTISSR